MYVTATLLTLRAVGARHVCNVCGQVYTIHTPLWELYVQCTNTSIANVCTVHCVYTQGTESTGPS